MPPNRAVRFLSLNSHGDHLPTLVELLQRPPDQATEVELLRALGGYSPAREAIIMRARSTATSEPVREAALRALVTHDKARFLQVAIEVVQQSTSSDAIRELVIDGITSARHTASVGQNAEALNLQLRRILDAPSATLRRAAWKSLKTHDPTFLTYADAVVQAEKDAKAKGIFVEDLKEIRRKAASRPRLPR